GQEGPIERVAEGFVDAYAVLVDGDPLRQAVDGRCAEAAILDVGLKDIALLVGEDDSGHVLLQRVPNGDGARPGDLGGRDGGNGTRDFADRKFASGDRRHPDGTDLNAGCGCRGRLSGWCCWRWCTFALRRRVGFFFRCRWSDDNLWQGPRLSGHQWKS